MPCLAFNLNNGKEFIFDLGERRLSLGRNTGNEIVVENSYISSFHAEITHSDADTYHVSDLASANGTFVNGERIEHAILKKGDILRVGQLEATLRETRRIAIPAKLTAKFVSPIGKITSQCPPRKATKALRLAKHFVPADSGKTQSPLLPPARPYVQNLAPTMPTAHPVSKPAPELRPVSENERISERITDLQEKHDFLARKVSTHLDEQTVILFANDLIKRLDLIDILINRYTDKTTDTSVVQQLKILRASFEDILAQHHISEYQISPGIELSIELRHRITIVENVPGPGKTRVQETCRPGYLYKAREKEIILRKVEVKTSAL